jgi:hypothetical protein
MTQPKRPMRVASPRTSSTSAITAMTARTVRDTLNTRPVRYASGVSSARVLGRLQRRMGAASGISLAVTCWAHQGQRPAQQVAGPRHSLLPVRPCQLRLAYSPNSPKSTDTHAWSPTTHAS